MHPKERKINKERDRKKQRRKKIAFFGILSIFFKSRKEFMSRIILVQHVLRICCFYNSRF